MEKEKDNKRQRLFPPKESSDRKVCISDEAISGGIAEPQTQRSRQAEGKELATPPGPVTQPIAREPTAGVTESKSGAISTQAG